MQNANNGTMLVANFVPQPFVKHCLAHWAKVLLTNNAHDGPTLAAIIDPGNLCWPIVGNYGTTMV